MHSPLLTKPVFTQPKVEPKRQASRQPRFTFWAGLALMVIILAVAVLHARGVFVQAPSRTIAPPPPQVAVSAPLQRDVDGRLEFLGQFSAVDHLELRAQVGGALTQIGFKDGDIVHKGDLLFVIDRVPYEIKLAQANAQLESATARLVLANRELARIQMLQARQVETAENLDQRAADQRAAQAAVDDAKAQIRDAQFDLDHCRIVAPFTGRIGSHLVSANRRFLKGENIVAPTTQPAIQRANLWRRRDRRPRRQIGRVQKRRHKRAHLPFLRNFDRAAHSLLSACCWLSSSSCSLISTKISR